MIDDTAQHLVARRPRRPHQRRRAAALAVLGAALLALSASLRPVAAATSAAELCETGDLDVEVAWDDAISDWVVSGMQMTDLGGSCDGVVVAVQVLGNPAGDPARPSSVLAETFSDEDPCTGRDIDPSAGSVRAGALVLELCDQGPAVTAHRVTGFRFFSALPAEALGESLAREDDGVATEGGFDVHAGGAKRFLPNTGSSPLSGGLIGVGVILLGSGLLQLARPGNRPTGASR